MKKRGFSFKWKLVENYAGALVGLVFLWLFVDGMINSDVIKIVLSIIVIIIAPFLLTFLDKRSSA